MSTLRILVKDGSLNLAISQIHYVQGSGNYTYIYTDKTKYVLSRTMRIVQAQLGQSFVRIHKGHAVNLSHVSGVERDGLSWQVRLQSGVSLAGSRRRFKQRDQIITHLIDKDND